MQEIAEDQKKNTIFGWKEKRVRLKIEKGKGKNKNKNLTSEFAGLK